MFYVIVTTSIDPSKTPEQRRQGDTITVHASPLKITDLPVEGGTGWVIEEDGTRQFAFGAFDTLNHAEYTINECFKDFAPTAVPTGDPTINRLEATGPIVAFYSRTHTTPNAADVSHFWLDLHQTVPSNLSQAERETLAARFEAMAVEQDLLLDHDTVMEFIDREKHRDTAEEVISVLADKIMALETRATAFKDTYPNMACTDYLDTILNDIAGIQHTLDVIDSISILPNEPLVQEWADHLVQKVRTSYIGGVEAYRSELPF